MNWHRYSAWAIMNRIGGQITLISHNCEVCSARVIGLKVACAHCPPQIIIRHKYELTYIFGFICNEGVVVKLYSQHNCAGHRPQSCLHTVSAHRYSSYATVATRINWLPLWCIHNKTLLHTQQGRLGPCNVCVCVKLNTSWLDICWNFWTLSWMGYIYLVLCQN